MKIERFAGHHEARDALVLSVAGVTAIMLIESLILRNLVLIAPLAQTAKPSAIRSQRLCLRPPYVPLSWAAIVRTSKLGSEADEVSVTCVPLQCRWWGRPSLTDEE